MFKATRGLVKGGFNVVGRGVSELALATTSVPGGDTIPLRRLGMGASMVLDPRGSTLLDALGDDPEERVHTMEQFMSRCTDEELGELLAVFQQAVCRRAVKAEPPC